MREDEISNDQVVMQLVDSAMEVYGVMLGLEVQAGEPKAATSGTPLGEVKGAIGLTGDYPGVIALNMSRVGAAQAVELLLGTPAGSATSAEIMDTVGEMTNMIAGGLKTRLSGGPGLAVEISLPTVLIGENYEYDAAGTGSCLVIPILGADNTTFLELFAADTKSESTTQPVNEPAVAVKEKS